MLDRLLGNRYKVLEKAGEGGMARVYKGVDLKLNRQVAIKILYDQFANDPEFLRRFQQEAKAAAKLSHPAIVNIYDEGEEKGIHYIVMEYVGGRTVKDIILQEGRFEPGAAARLALQICDALVHAHRHGVIHRDIKPQNIIITPEGRAKVTDFGIARATTDSTITYGKSLFGSVYYSSPEQARGGHADQKSDIYSLGVVLYEMLTGEVPFSGESPVSIALKHLQEEIVPPDKIVPGIPASLGGIVTRSTHKDPAGRYANATEFRDNLKEWLNNHDQNSYLDYSSLGKFKSTGFQSPGLHEEKGQESGEEGQEGRSTMGRKRLSSQKMMVYAVILVAALLIIILGPRLLANYLIVPEVTVPDLAGLSLARAKEELSLHGLDSRIAGEVYSDTVPIDHVVSQDPPAERSVRQERIIELYLSKGPEYVEVPPLVGKTELEARLLLDDRGLHVDFSGREHSDEIPAGHIIRQNPGSGFRLSEGDTVHVIVSMGKKSFSLRNFQDWPLDKVQEWLDLYGLVLQNIEREYSDEFAEGRVISQFPSKGEPVQAGDPVDLVISKGREEAPDEVHQVFYEPRVEAGRNIKIYLEDQEGTKVIFEGISQGQVIAVEGVGTGRIVLMELKDGEYFMIDTKMFP